MIACSNMLDINRSPRIRISLLNSILVKKKKFIDDGVYSVKVSMFLTKTASCLVCEYTKNLNGCVGSKLALNVELFVAVTRST